MLSCTCPRPSTADGRQQNEAGSSQSVNTRTPLYLLSLLPYPAEDGAGLSPSYSEAPSLMPALELAVTHVNARDDLLGDYELELVPGDSGCDIAYNAHLSFVKHIFGRRSMNGAPSETTNNTANYHSSNQNIVGIIGPICSESTLDIAKLVSRPRIALINVHPATYFAPEGTSRLNYSFGITAPASELIAALIAFVKHTGWERIAVLYEQNRLFYRELYQEFVTGMQAEGVDLSVILALSDLNEIPRGLSAIESAGLRVSVLFLGTTFNSELLCLSSSGGFVFPNYQWVLIAQSTSEILHNPSALTQTCTGGYRNITLEDSFLIQHQLKPDAKLQLQPNTTAVASLDYAEFYRQYAAEIDKKNEVNPTLTPSAYGTLLYDSVWALALAFNNSAGALDERGFTLADYKYDMHEIGDIISQELLKLKFDGVSGHVDFRAKDGFTTRPIEIRQIVTNEGREVVFAQYSFGNLTVLPLTENLGILRDSFPRLDEHVNIAASVIFFILALLHFAVVVSVHVATIVFRNRRSVKATSNKLNQFILAGNYLVLLAICLNIFINSFDLSHGTISAVCQVIWPWTLSIGSTLIAGTISVRTWRIYRIFIHSWNPGRFISSRALSIILCVLVGIDLLLAIAWTATDPITVRVVSEQVKNDGGYVFLQVSLMCVSGSTKIWLALIMFYKVVLLTAMITLAILTRKVKGRDFTTLNLRIVSYVLAFTVGLGFTLFFFLYFVNVDQIIDYVVLNVVLHTLVLQNLVLVLIPPLLPVLKEMYKDTSNRCCGCNIVRVS